MDEQLVWNKQQRWTFQNQVQAQVPLLEPRLCFSRHIHTYGKHLEAHHIIQLRTVEIKKWQIKKFLQVQIVLRYRSELKYWT